MRGEQGHSEGGQGLKPRIVLKIMTAKISGGGGKGKVVILIVVIPSL